MYGQYLIIYFIKIKKLKTFLTNIRRDLKNSSKEYIKEKYNKKDKIFVCQSVDMQMGQIYEQILSINHLKVGVLTREIAIHL